MSRWWIIGISAFVFFIVVVGFGAPFTFRSDDPMLAYVGGIVANALSGSMTIVAGWMAWRVGQRQIEKQQHTLDLTLLDVRQRTIHQVVGAERQALIKHLELLQILNSVNEMADRKRVSLMIEPIEGVGAIFDDPESWRLGQENLSLLRELSEALTCFNKGKPIVFWAGDPHSIFIPLGACVLTGSDSRELSEITLVLREQIIPIAEKLCGLLSSDRRRLEAEQQRLLRVTDRAALAASEK